MRTDPAKNEDEPTLQDVLDALDDPDCRDILKNTDEPMTAKELAKHCKIPPSTVYRKLDLLSTTSLVRELMHVDSERGRITRYQRDFENVTISVGDDDQFDVAIDRQRLSADERLAEIWSEMGDEL